MEKDYGYETDKGESVFALMMHKYLPYWPLFVGMLIISLLGAWTYLHYLATPAYEASATLIIKDENKGVDDAKMMESINMFNSKKIVENEIEVIKSRELMETVVTDLYLYAPVFEDKNIKSVSAYLSSPILVKHRDPDKIALSTEKTDKVYFRFDETPNLVQLGNTGYPVNEWVRTDYGELQFILNPQKMTSAENPLYFTLVNPRLVADHILSELEVNAANKLSTVVYLKLKDPVRQRGENILNNLIHAYNQAAITDRTNLANNTLTFIEDRIKYVENDLNQLEKEVQQYRSNKGVIDLSEQGKLYLQNVGNNDQKIADINLQLAVLDKVEKYVISKENRIGIVPSTLGVNDAVLAQLLEKLYDAEIEYERLRKTVARKNPILISLANEIEKVRPSILENIRSQRVNLNASLVKLNSTNGNYNTILQTLPEKERELLELTRRKAIKHDLFSFLLQKREETALSYAPSNGDSRVIDMAASSPLPVSPKPLFIYAIATILAFGAGIGLVVGKEVITNKILYRTDIEELTNIPVVGEVLHINNNKKQHSRYTDKLISDQIKDIRFACGLYGTTVQKQVVLITSSIEGEGKSFISENLAINIASSRKRVVLMNFDLQKPYANSIFSFGKHVGLSEYLTDGIEPAATVSATEYENLYIIPAGKASETAVTGLLDAELKNLFTYLRREFDYIIVDTPPVGVATDAYIIAKYCNALLYVVRHNFTPKKAIENLERTAKLYYVNNLAIIFNDIRSRGFVGSGYGFHYGYGYKNINQYTTSIQVG